MKKCNIIAYLENENTRKKLGRNRMSNYNDNTFKFAVFKSIAIKGMWKH